ncbi:Glutathione peroxidase [Roseibacterium elongatum DSM 19469]|uniref:Glutathione peroxidase n=1 Tax=Roseicyclus elongatus DSM 19469 TaxID=1294273 RepID=W8S2G5_9RHOB|nr:glutathione peroxidase [Roseibacterium elongatum]AHM04397.1 Glutathione peroxidase [Roseibacterium elongatum DSM 19469]
MIRLTRRSFASALAILPAATVLTRAGSAQAVPAFQFESIDGGQYDLSDWAGRPILVVNTASMCAYTPQYDQLQALHETYGPRGLVVLAVPSDDFAQEFDSEDEVAEFCDLNFNLTLPMTTITRVRSPDAHPFFAWLDQEYGVRPGWNFNKVLLGPDGRLVEHFGSATRPMGRRMRSRIESLLNT